MTLPTVRSGRPQNGWLLTRPSVFYRGDIAFVRSSHIGRHHFVPICLKRGITLRKAEPSASSVAEDDARSTIGTRET